MTDTTFTTPLDRLLIVDDIAPIRELYRDVAEEAGYAVYEAECASSMATVLEETIPTIVLLDLTMPKADGLEILRDLARIDFDGVVILASGQDQGMIATAQRFGRMLGLNLPLTLTKPVSANSISALLEEFSHSENRTNISGEKSA